MHATNTLSRFSGKVFCIGFNKTSTSSMKLALAQLGFSQVTLRSPHPSRRRLMSYGYTRLAQWFNDGSFPLYVATDDISWMTQHKDLENLIREVSKRASMFGDSPWLYLYQPLNELYPDSRFILTRRSTTRQVVISAAKQAMRSIDPSATSIGDHLDKIIFGVPLREYLRLIARGYERHNDNVLRYFSAHPEPSRKLLELDIPNEPDPWGKLCGFLECTKPQGLFPDVNKAPAIQDKLTLPANFSLDWKHYRFQTRFEHFFRTVRALEESQASPTHAAAALHSFYSPVAGSGQRERTQWVKPGIGQ